MVGTCPILFRLPSVYLLMFCALPEGFASLFVTDQLDVCSLKLLSAVPLLYIVANQICKLHILSLESMCVH